MSNEELTSLEKALAAYAIGLDIAVTCLVKVTGQPEKAWQRQINKEARKALQEIPPQKLKEMLTKLKEEIAPDELA